MDNPEFREGLEDLASHYKSVITLLGEDVEREGLQKTPMRVAKAMQVLTRGYSQDPHKVLTDALFKEDYKQMVVVKDIDVFSLCEHHMLPFYGKASRAKRQAVCASLKANSGAPSGAIVTRISS